MTKREFLDTVFALAPNEANKIMDAFDEYVTTENHVIWKGYRWNATYWDDEIIAWMPLPEPYKAVTG